MKKKHFSKNITLIIISSAVLIVVFITYLLLYSDILKAKKKVEGLYVEMKEQAGKNDELDAIQKNTKLKVSDRELLDSFFVLSDSVVEFVELVESVAKRSGLTITTKNIEPKESEILTPLNKELISITIETKGGWQDTMQFIGLLTNLPYKISIISTNFSYLENAPVNEDSKEVSVSGFTLWNTGIVFDVVKTIDEVVEKSKTE